MCFTIALNKDIVSSRIWVICIFNTPGASIYKGYYGTSMPTLGFLFFSDTHSQGGQGGEFNRISGDKTETRMFSCFSYNDFKQTNLFENSLNQKEATTETP